MIHETPFLSIGIETSKKAKQQIQSYFDSLYYCQWQIKNFPKAGVPTLQGSAYISFCQMFPNVANVLHEIEIIWTPRGHVCNILLCRSTTDCVNFVKFSFTMLSGFVFLICSYDNWNIFWQKFRICFQKIIICGVLALCTNFNKNKSET